MQYQDTDTFAKEMDEADPLRAFRAEFHIPPSPGGRECVYLTGNSLGLQPKAARQMVEQELEDWARMGVDGHLHGRNPWLPYHEQFREPLGRLIGALPSEVVAMNTLTVNLHLLMVSFYRPTRERYRIVVEGNAFPSDQYAVASQARFHGLDPDQAVVHLRPRDGESTLRPGAVEEYLQREGGSAALVLLGGVNYLSGQWFDMASITAAGRQAGCVVGWDLAHAAGNVPLRLHDWGADFAAWCSYKYLNSGPGAVAGAYIHERHHKDSSLPRFDGWWGTAAATRFQMRPAIEPPMTADNWSLSNPPILSLAPLKASLGVFERAGMDRIREKSVKLTGYMEWLLEKWCGGRVRVWTPREAGQRGAQLSIAVAGAGRELERRLHAEGVVVDYREQGNLIRAAPTGLYNSFADVRRFVETLKRVIGA